MCLFMCIFKIYKTNILHLMVFQLIFELRWCNFYLVIENIDAKEVTMVKQKGKKVLLLPTELLLFNKYAKSGVFPIKFSKVSRVSNINKKSRIFSQSFKVITIVSGSIPQIACSEFGLRVDFFCLLIFRYLMTPKPRLAKYLLRNGPFST